MGRIELIARELCKFEGRNPDHETNRDEPQWRRYEPQARVILWALKHDLKEKHD